MSINSEGWNSIEVADWIAGLGSVPSGLNEELGHESRYKESEFSTYSSNFHENNVNGRLLLNLMSGDLHKYGVINVGDQLLLHEAIQALRSELDTPRVTLQSLASTLAVRCRNYRAELSLLSSSKSQIASTSSINYIPTESLTSASYLLDSSKVLIRWMTRFPFLGNPEYDQITVKITKHSFELAMLSQRDTFADNAIEEVQYLCTKLIEICEDIIHSKDSLIIQPAAIDVITLRKRTEQELGLHLESSYFGLHQVSGVKLSSPAQQSGHLEKGDEILQVNYQTVIGWPQKNVVHLLHENSNEVVLTIKRRPRHAAANILAHMYLRPSNKLMGSTHRSNKRRHATEKIMQNQTTLSLPSAHLQSRQSLRHHQKSMPISPVPEDENSSSSTTSSSGNSPVVLLDVNVNTSPSISSSSASPGIIKDPSPRSPKQLDDKILSVSVDNQNPSKSTETDSDPSVAKSPNSSSANSRFWKLYPRPRNLIRRRATVTGASPTSTRPPVTFFDDENTEPKLRPPLINSKSAPEKIRVGLRKQGNVNIPTDQQSQQLHHRVTMPPVLDLMFEFSPSTGKPLEKEISEDSSTSGGTNSTITLPTKSSVSDDSDAAVKMNSLSDEKSKSTSVRRGDTLKQLNGEKESSQHQSCKSILPPLPKEEKEHFPFPSSTTTGSGDSAEISVILKGILHLRQSPSNLLVKSNSLTSTSGSSTGFSPHPRWTRHPAVLNSARILQIGSDPDASLKINLGETSSCEVSLATEVHSRPFAFKIDTKIRPNFDEKISSGIYYLAAESQQEFETWIKLLMKKDSIGSLVRTGSGVKDIVYQRVRATPALYKRSISLGNSPSYSRRSSSLISHISHGLSSGLSGSANTRESTSHEAVNQQHNLYQPRSTLNSSINRKQNLIRSSRLIGSSVPNVPASVTSFSGQKSSGPVSQPALSPLQRKISNNESVKSEWFNSPLTPTNANSSRDFPTMGNKSSHSKNSTRVGLSLQNASNSNRATSTTGPSMFGDIKHRVTTTTSSSNISSITIRSVVRKSDSDYISGVNSPPGTPQDTSRFKCRTASGSKLPSMGVSMVLAKHHNSPSTIPSPPPTQTQSAHGTPVSTPKSFPNPSTLASSKKSSSSSTSSSDVFIKDDQSTKKHSKRFVNCPSCGSSTSLTPAFFAGGEKKDSATQTEEEQQSSTSTITGGSTSNLDLELLRHLINEQEGSRV